MPGSDRGLPLNDIYSSGAPNSVKPMVNTVLVYLFSEPPITKMFPFCSNWPFCSACSSVSIAQSRRKYTSSAWANRSATLINLELFGRDGTTIVSGPLEVSTFCTLPRLDRSGVPNVPYTIQYLNLEWGVVAGKCTNTLPRSRSSKAEYVGLTAVSVGYSFNTQ